MLGPNPKHRVGHDQELHSFLSFFFLIFSFQALKIAAWAEGDLEVIDGFSVPAKQMCSFYGHQTPGLGLSGWQCQLPGPGSSCPVEDVPVGFA